MGAFLSRNTPQSTYAACADMREVVAEDKWMDLLGRPGDLRVVDVNLAKLPYDDRALGFRFKLQYCGEQPAGCSVLLLFPNLNDASRQVLDTAHYQSSYAALDKEINARLEASKIDSAPTVGHVSSLKLAVISGQHVFRIWNITGNVYLYWLRKLHIYNTSGVGQLPLINVPILVETDSRMGYRSLVHFNYDEASASARAPTAASGGSGGAGGGGGNARAPPQRPQPVELSRHAPHQRLQHQKHAFFLCPDCAVGVA